VPPELLSLLAGKDILLGVIDVTNEAVETPEEVAAEIDKAMRFVAKDRLFPCTNCGMAPMRWEIAEAKLRALGAGAALARGRFA
jgi:5-methyltetrahydropteroyltriglutamate--homocysteine methyltransferase